MTKSVVDPHQRLGGGRQYGDTTGEVGLVNKLAFHIAHHPNLLLVLFDSSEHAGRESRKSRV